MVPDDGRYWSDACDAMHMSSSGESSDSSRATTDESSTGDHSVCGDADVFSSGEVLGKMAFLDEALDDGSATHAHDVMRIMQKELRKCKERLTDDQYHRLVALIEEFIDVFYREGDKIKPLRTGLVSMNIPPDSRPVAIRGKRLNPAQRTVLIEYVKRLSDLGVVKRIHNTEGWLNQMLFVKKGDGSLRPCLDLRATINSLSRPLVSSLPHAQDCVDALGGSKYITIQDAKSAYWQLELHPDDIKYTSFSSPLGTSM